MTTENLNFNSERGDDNKERVLEAVRELAGSLPYQITKYIEIQAHDAARIKVKEGKISKNEIKGDTKKNRLDIRTVHRKLVVLYGEGRVEKRHDGRYYISDLALSDPRFGEHAARFGQLVLGNALSIHFPTLFVMEHNVKKLIDILGSCFLIFSLEAMRPVTEGNFSKLLKDKLAVEWFSKLIDSQFLLDAVISALTNQVTDRDLEKISKINNASLENGLGSISKNKLDIKQPLSTSYFHEQRFRYICSTKGHKDYKKKRNKPLYELDDETISKVLGVVEKLHPECYKRAMKARELFLERPKENSLPDRFYSS